MSDLFVNSQAYDEDSGASFRASTRHVSHLAELFDSVAAVSSQALVIIRPTGIIVYAEYNKLINFQVTLDPTLFFIYNFNSSNSEAELRLGVDVHLISNAFSSASSTNTQLAKGREHIANDDEPMCYVSYSGEGFPLEIEFEDKLITEKIEFLTFYVDFSYPPDDQNENENLSINHTEIQFELLLNGNVFFNLLSDLQQIGTQELFFHVSNDWEPPESRKANSSLKYSEKQLSLISRGPVGLSKLIYPAEKTKLEKLEIYNSTDMAPIKSSVISCYRFEDFIRVIKAARMAVKCKLLKDRSGVLSLQLLCKYKRLPNYSGTLVTFNVMEMSTFNESDVTQLLYEDNYEFVKHYRKESSVLIGRHADRSFDNNSNRVQIRETIYGPNKASDDTHEPSDLQELRNGDDIPLFL